MQKLNNCLPSYQFLTNTYGNLTMIETSNS